MLTVVGGPLVAAGHQCGNALRHVRAAKGSPTTLPPPAGKIGGCTTTLTRCIPGGTTTSGEWT